jgi:hypothetical protein
MSATKSGGPELLPPEDSDSDEDLDEEVLRFRRGELDKLLKQKEKERVESAQKSIDAVKSEYAELKDAQELLFVSFEEPK